MYKILWIDDDHEEFDEFKSEARIEGIDLVSYKSFNSGIAELERNYRDYDGVLLDAKFYRHDDNVPGEEDLDNIYMVNERILRLPKSFEVFVLTGFDNLYQDEMFKRSFPKVYQKGKSSEIDRLIADIKEAALRLVDTQIRAKHKRVFDVCTEEYIGEQAGRDLLTFLKIEEPSDSKEAFNDLRKVMEAVFKAFNRNQLLPDDFVTGGVKLNPSYKFIACQPLGQEFKMFRNLNRDIPPVILENFISVMGDSQAGSHVSDIDLHVKDFQTTYKFQSILYQLLDIIIWVKRYFDSNPKKENWKIGEEGESGINRVIVESVTGRVERFEGKNYAFFLPDVGMDNTFIPPALVSKHSLVDGLVVCVNIQEKYDKRKGESKREVCKVEVLGS